MLSKCQIMYFVMKRVFLFYFFIFSPINAGGWRTVVRYYRQKMRTTGEVAREEFRFGTNRVFSLGTGFFRALVKTVPVVSAQFAFAAIALAVAQSDGTLQGFLERFSDLKMWKQAGSFIVATASIHFMSELQAVWQKLKFARVQLLENRSNALFARMENGLTGGVLNQQQPDLILLHRFLELLNLFYALNENHSEIPSNTQARLEVLAQRLLPRGYDGLPVSLNQRVRAQREQDNASVGGLQMGMLSNMTQLHVPV